MSLLSEEKLRELFSNTYDFYNALVENRERLSNFFLYTFKRFEIGSPFDKGEEIENCLNLISQKKNDYEMFLYLRKRQQESKPKDGISLQNMKQREIEVVTKRRMDNVSKKAKDVKDACYKHRISFGTAPHCQVQTILDIGTEKLEFLDALEQQFHLPKGNVKGINIEVGFCHYEDTFKDNETDKRFQLYDGKNIPFKDNAFDLVTMFSVIHHIPTPDFKIVAAEICRVCNGYLYLKDVDLKDDVSAILFRIQHYLYEGVLFPGNFSYMNSTVTMQETIDILETVGFETVYKAEWNNFNSTYNVLLKKKGSNPSLRSKRKINEISTNTITEREPKIQRKEESSSTDRERKARTGFRDQLTRIFPSSSKSEFSYDKIHYVIDVLNVASTHDFAKRTKDWILQLKNKYIPKTPLVIIDGCAGLGSNTIAFVKTQGSFEQCIAVEIDPVLVDCIAQNIKLYGLSNYVECVNDDIVEWCQRKYETNFKDSILFLDPVPQQQHSTLQIFDDLELSSKSKKHSLVQFVEQAITHLHVPLLVLRLPSNFNTDRFKTILPNIIIEENRSNRNWILVGLVNNNTK